MKINVRTLPPEGLTFEKVIQSQELGISEEDALILTPVRIKVHANKAGDELCCKVEAEGSYGFECGRCLDKVREDRVDEFEIFCEITPETDSVDISDDIRQELIVALTSSVVLCSPACKGLCPTCGVNLNEEKCFCSKKAKNSGHMRTDDDMDDKPRRMKL